MDTLFKDTRLEELAREIARMEGASVPDAVERALMERKARLEDIERRRRAVEPILAEFHKMTPITDEDVDSLLYDEDGLPK